MQFPATMQPTRARIEQIAPEDEAALEGSTIFPPVGHKMAKNFYIADTYAESPPVGLTSATYAGDDSSNFLSSFNGLGAVSDDLKDLLPPECRAAFDKALDGEKEWHKRWGPEKDTMSRREPVIDKAIVPYSMT